MAIKLVNKTSKDSIKIDQFINAGGTLPNEVNENDMDVHRLTLRIPKALMHAIDSKRKEKRVGKISRNLWILEQIEKATR